jgi:hypothetical protein
LNFYKTTCLYSTQEVALAALKNFKILVQYLKPSDQPLPDNVLKKVDFLASKVFQVWIAFGQGIIDGADESNWVETEKVYVPIVEWSNDRKPHLLQGPFSQDCLSQYCSVFFELYPIIQSSFGLVEFDKVTDLWQDLILYHSKPPAGATQSKLRSDIVNDVDTMTPTQSQFIDFLTGKVEFKGIDGIDQLIFVLLADLTTLPFIPFAIQCVGKTEAETKVPCYTSPFLKKHSFIAISRKAFTVIQSKYEALTEQEALYSSGAFEHILVSLQLPLQYKYDCPFVGNKDTTPLWKTAIIITKRLLSDSLFVLFDLEGIQV